MGSFLSILDQFYPPKPKFGVADIPDLTGKVIVVTGANSGIGKETAKALLNRNAKVYIAARSETRARQAIRDLEAVTGNTAIFLKLDLSDLQSVKAAAAEFLSKETELHVLFNNAGVMTPPIDMITTHGYDLQWGTNVLGHFYFTKLVLPALLAGSKSSPDRKARVINTSSSSALFIDTADPSTFKDGPARRKTDPRVLYHQSKLGNVLFSNELARRYGDQGIISVSLNPGNLDTELARHSSRMLKWVARTFIVYPAHLGALTQLWAGTTPAGLDMNGKFLIPWARIGKQPHGATDKLEKEIWEWCEEQVKSL